VSSGEIVCAREICKQGEQASERTVSQLYTLNALSRALMSPEAAALEIQYNAQYVFQEYMIFLSTVLLQEPLKPRTNVSCRFLENQHAISL
jgi:hypothetical protein